MAATVGVKLAVNVSLGGTGVSVEAGVSVGGSPQEERKSKMLNAVRRIRNIDNLMRGYFLERQVILFGWNRDFNYENTMVNFTQFWVE